MKEVCIVKPHGLKVSFILTVCDVVRHPCSLLRHVREAAAGHGWRGMGERCACVEITRSKTSETGEKEETGVDGGGHSCKCTRWAITGWRWGSHIEKTSRKCVNYELIPPLLDSNDSFKRATLNNSSIEMG